MKTYILPALLLLLASCSGRMDKKQELPQEIQELHAPVANAEVPAEFREFLERFSTDSLFQREHVEFPLKFTHANHDGVKDSTFTVSEKVYSSVDLVNPGDDHWGNPTETLTEMKGDNNATVIVRGQNTGIYIEFFFELVKGKWTLKEVIDSST